MGYGGPEQAGPADWTGSRFSLRRLPGAAGRLPFAIVLYVYAVLCLPRRLRRFAVSPPTDLLFFIDFRRFSFILGLSASCSPMAFLIRPGIIFQNLEMISSFFREKEMWPK